MVSGQNWESCDDDVKLFLLDLVEGLRSQLGSQLTGIYLHGSLAMGSYYRPKSDMDLIVVVKKPLGPELAEDLGVAVATHAIGRPSVGSIELSVITAEVAKKVPVPTPFEVHYSSQWHEQILRREIDYTKERTDSDLLSHLTYVLQRGICLFGKPIAEVFGAVGWEHFMASVLADCQWILEGDHILESPYYGVLNLCRVLQLCSEDSQRVYSKDEGGEWGLAHLPREYHPIIQQALAVYRSADAVTEEERATGGRDWDQEQLLAFSDYARWRLEGLMESCQGDGTG
ncbi:MAG: DUF4111 domain-containing protein [Firmicutes bacterium]|nr:DUF4111 domain-containing protein [Bacillota bacterium]